MRERTLLIRQYQLGHDSATDEGSSNEPKLVLEDLEDHLTDTTSKSIGTHELPTPKSRDWKLLQNFTGLNSKF